MKRLVIFILILTSAFALMGQIANIKNSVKVVCLSTSRALTDMEVRTYNRILTQIEGIRSVKSVAIDGYTFVEYDGSISEEEIQQALLEKGFNTTIYERKIEKDEDSPITNFEKSKNHEITADWKPGGKFAKFKPEQEDVSRRTRVAKHFKMDDGTYSAVIGDLKHYKDENGNWEDVDFSIKNNSLNADYSYSNLTHEIKSYFPESPSTNGIKLQKENLVLSFWNNTKFKILSSDLNVINEFNSSNQIAKIKDNGIYYESYTGMVEEFVVLENGLKNNIYLQSMPLSISNANNSDFLSFEQFIPLKNVKVYSDNKEFTNDFTANSFSIKPSKDVEGFIFSDIVVFDNTLTQDEANILLTLPEEKITESQKQKINNHILRGTYHIKFVQGGILVSTVMPVNWFKNSNRSYPVTIDPNITIGTGTSTQRNPFGFLWAILR